MEDLKPQAEEREPDVRFRGCRCCWPSREALSQRGWSCSWHKAAAGSQATGSNR